MEVDIWVKDQLLRQSWVSNLYVGIKVFHVIFNKDTEKNVTFIKKNNSQYYKIIT